jgi:hypothetical protein
MRWTGYERSMGQTGNIDNILVGKPEGIKPLGRCKLCWVDNIRMNLREIV